MPVDNHMKLVMCAGVPTLANAAKGKDNYRCTKCGQTGHDIVKGGK